MSFDRRALRAALRSAYAWIDDPDAGPQVVDAGECDRCGRRPRFVPTCGPAGAEAVCRDCALEAGLALWCDGHADTGSAVLSALRSLPAEWDAVTRLWWVATGEVRLDTLVAVRDVRIDPGVEHALGRRGRTDP